MRINFRRGIPKYEKVQNVFKYIIQNYEHIYTFFFFWGLCMLQLALCWRYQTKCEEHNQRYWIWGVILRKWWLHMCRYDKGTQGARARGQDRKTVHTIWELTVLEVSKQLRVQGFGLAMCGIVKPSQYTWLKQVHLHGKEIKEPLLATLA